MNFPSSPAAVTILNPPRNTITKVIRANNPKIRLIKFLITCIKLPPLSTPAPETPTPAVPPTSPNCPGSKFCALTNAILHTPNSPAIPRPSNNFLNIF